MKCIKLFTEEIVRVSDERAAAIVSNRLGEYCGKEEWKASKRDFKVSEDQKVKETPRDPKAKKKSDKRKKS